jgi:hypothetical protein|tara:strand:+ start:925 stop:1137 length:213 start_codon:yes stop_codon:yes gene_type:complete
VTLTPIKSKILFEKLKNLNIIETSVLPAVFTTLRTFGEEGQLFYFLQIVKIMGLNRRIQLHTLASPQTFL